MNRRDWSKVYVVRRSARAALQEADRIVSELSVAGPADADAFEMLAQARVAQGAIKDIEARAGRMLAEFNAEAARQAPSDDL